MFDRAAIRLRGHRAKLNFNIQEYMDSSVSYLHSQTNGKLAACRPQKSVVSCEGDNLHACSLYHKKLHA
jgi:hypothetical protein